MTGAELNSLLAAVLLAFGITVPLPDFAGGMLMALGCAYGVRAFRRMDDRKGIVLTLFAGGLVALLTAIVHPGLKSIWLWGGLPLQAQMALAGALSQAVMEGAIAFGRGLAERAGKVPGAIRLPGEGDPR